jgi:transcription-repair coupling factor (superfamily II helicase)
VAQWKEAPAANELFARIVESPAAQSLARRLEQGGALSCSDVAYAAQPFFVALLRVLFPTRAIIAVTEGQKEQERFHQDLQTWMGLKSKEPGETPTSRSADPLFYPAWEILPHEARLPHVDVISERLETLVALSGFFAAPSGLAPLVVTTVAALAQKTFRAEEIKRRTRRLERGMRIDPLDLVEWLEGQGYEPEAQVTQKGEIALRGGILDLFPLTSPWPVRLEFFGDELESLRFFDPLTQLTREEITIVDIPPGGELGILQKNREKPELLGTLIETLPPKSIFVLCEPEVIDQRAQEYAVQVPAGDPFFQPWQEFLESARSAGMTLLGLNQPEIEEIRPELNLDPDSASSPECLLHFQSLDLFRPLAERAPDPQLAEAQRREFFAQLHRWLRQGYQVHVFCNNDGERQRLEEIWKDYGLNLETPDSKQPSEIQPTVHIGALARGFIQADAKIVIVTDAEIFGRYKIQRPRRLKSPHAQATRSALDIDFAELEEGDFVVHLQHGIGLYRGLQVLPMGAGAKPTESVAANLGGQECLVIEYGSSDPAQPPPKLYVPVTESHLVSKYVGTGKVRPPLNTLGGTRWAKTKAHAERAVRDVASDLLAIQAARESQPGYSLGPDTQWQHEFEGSFIYEETPDQLRAIQETKLDLERPKPMDRLICGDVGFGKTEVGIRAAFKAVMGGKQVAVLVPTTVLAQQHYNTFSERMADYPVKVDLLSRFRTRKQQDQVVRELAAGSVDIVIGTHRLLQKDIAFKDLGLVIVDEEQRFGVMHKEKFKLLRKLVDVLTLSATPIPRTLYLALTGARDMSTIQTPPHDRLPVETIVTAYDERVIRDAIQREMNRGGQVFFLHNRVATIQAMAQKIQTLVPKARLVIGHGQMHSDDLEQVMTQFINGQADVLLSTTIIESGLDIPNANTIIIDRADRFGLSDLYQLRGRVGRYKHQAYAYLLLPRHGTLVADVRKRLSAIKQYSTLGSGFKIAMRDLEIRGAGNLLGSEQSGHITAVGFELYCQLLKQSVASQKGEKVSARVEVHVRLDFLALNPINETPARPLPSRSDRAREITMTPPASIAPIVTAAYIPFAYVSDSRQRIEIYRKLAQTSDKKALDDLERELKDRFGPIPPALQLLMQVGELKVLAAARGITVIEVKEDRLMLTRNNDYIMVGSKFPRLSKPDAAGRLKEIRKLLMSL